MAELYRFAAFISYASKDAVFARRLHRSLEAYRVPAALGSFDLAGHKNRIYPVFRDREELPAGDLTEGLQAALRASNALIVVCSPNAAASEWVLREIAYFAGLGRRARIFTIIAPDAPLEASGMDATAGSFPSIFTGKPFGDVAPLEPLAADARKGKDGEHNAVLKVIAGLIGANAGDLQNRDRIRRRKRLAAMASAATIALIALGVGAWGYVIPHVSYAKDFVRRFGVWEEVDRLSSDDAGRRETSLRFTRAGAFGPVTGVDYVNGYGACPEAGLNGITRDKLDFDCNKARGCGARFTYDGERIVREEMIDQYGNVIETIAYDGPASAIRTEAVRGCSRHDNGITLVELTRTASGPQAGFDELVRFMGADRNPRANDSYAYAYAFVRDDAGHLLETRAQDAEGRPALVASGWATERRERDANGEIANWIYLGVSGEPVVTQEGWSSQAVARDEAGNALSIRNIGPDGQPAVDRDGAHGRSYVRNLEGAAIELSYLDAEGRPVTGRNNVPIETYSVDGRGYKRGASFLDAQRQPTLTSEGCASVAYEVSAEGDRLSIACFGLKGEPVLRKDHTHRDTTTLNGRGDIVGQSYFGIDGLPALNEHGAHAYAFDWNEVGQKLASRNLGIDGQPILASDGIAGKRSAYDKNGYIVSERYIGLDGEPGAASNGTFGLDYEVDAYGKRIASTPVGADGRPMLSSDGFATVRNERDEFGREIRRSFFDLTGAPTLTKSGAASFTLAYDAMGRKVANRFFNLDGSPGVGSSGVHIFETSYDAQGNEAEYTYRDTAGELTPNKNGAAREVVTFDTRGRRLSVRYLDASGAPVLSADGYAEFRESYGDGTKPEETRYFGTDGTPIADKRGVAGHTARYDSRGNRIEFSFRDLTWEPILPVGEIGGAIFRYSFDERDREVERTFFNADGTPVLSSEGIHGWTSTYDERGNEVGRAFFGTDRRPAIVAGDGFAYSERTYGRGSRLVEERYLDVNHEPIRPGRARATYSYDRFGNELNRRFYDADGKLALAEISGRALVKFTYDDRTRLIEEASLGVAEEPVDRPDKGWHRKTITYAAGGAKLKEVCYKVSGAVTPCEPEQLPLP